MTVIFRLDATEILYCWRPFCVRILWSWNSPLSCTLRFFKKLGYSCVVWTWLSTNVFHNEKFYCILNTLLYFPLPLSVWQLGYRPERRLGVWLPAGARDFSLLQNLQYRPGAHPASCLIGAGLKRMGNVADHSLIVPEVKNEWVYTSTSPHAFMAWFLIKHHNFIFTIIKACLDIDLSSAICPPFSSVIIQWKSLIWRQNWF